MQIKIITESSFLTKYNQKLVMLNHKYNVFAMTHMSLTLHGMAQEEKI